MNNIMVIDPGINGGLAWVDDGIVQCQRMPEGMSAQADFIRSLGIKRCVMEKVGTYRPGNSGPGAATFARHCGNLEAILYMCGISVTQVTPKAWMYAIGTWPQDKAERKKRIKEEMARRYPHLSVTLMVSDALGMLTWALKHG